MSDRRLAVVGSGRVGLSLAADLAQMQLFRSVTVIGRRPDRPGFLEGLPDVAYRMAPEGTDPAATGPPQSEPREGDPPRDDPAETDPARLAVPDALLFCLPDDLLGGVASAWARELEAIGASAGVAIHTSGLHPGAVLEPLRTLGWRVGSWHPLLALAAPRRGAFVGVSVGVEGDPEAVALGERFASALGARILPVHPEAKDHYHAGAVFASNFLVACLAVALRELRCAAGEAAGPEHLIPLARSALENVAVRGLAGGTTGPLARGDLGTVSRHLATLDARTAALYRALASELLRTSGAEASGPLGARWARLLEGSEGLPGPPPED